MDAKTEAASKKKRGRPPVMSAIDKVVVEAMGGGCYTHRHRLNMKYLKRALLLLFEDIRFSWIVTKDTMMDIDCKWKPGILSELGRIQDNNELIAMALEICDLKPKTKTAIAMIRSARLGKEGKPDITGAISAFLKRYIDEHPTVTVDEVKESIMSAAEWL